MALQGTLVCLFSLAVWSSAAQDETTHQNCSSQPQLSEQLSAALKVAVECGESLPWSTQQTAALLLSMNSLTDSLHKHQLKGLKDKKKDHPDTDAALDGFQLVRAARTEESECQGAEPRQCPKPQVPDNGALVCVTVANKRYCKPMCNDGYDFSFLRRSRLYDECSEQTGYKWNTQYTQGTTLAVCNRQSVQVSGVKTAYFPKDQDCLKTKSDSQLQNNITEVFVAELRSGDIQGALQHLCLVCGWPRG